MRCIVCLRNLSYGRIILLTKFFVEIGTSHIWHRATLRSFGDHFTYQSVHLQHRYL